MTDSRYPIFEGFCQLIPIFDVFGFFPFFPLCFISRALQYKIQTSASEGDSLFHIKGKKEYQFMHTWAKKVQEDLFYLHFF